MDRIARDAYKTVVPRGLWDRASVPVKEAWRKLARKQLHRETLLQDLQLALQDLENERPQVKCVVGRRAGDMQYELTEVQRTRCDERMVVINKLWEVFREHARPQQEELPV